MAKPVFRQYRQHETMVLPPGLDDFIDENHPCRIVSDVIDRLDLSKSEATCKGGGKVRGHLQRRRCRQL